MGDYREVGKHTGEQNVVGKGAPPGSEETESKLVPPSHREDNPPMALFLGFLPMRTACLCLPFAGELMDKVQ